MNQVAIKSISVEGLHEQYNVELNFQQDLNVIYGKNGRGKTTILHILANILELDFHRFKHIKFRRVELQTYGGNSVSITSENPKFSSPMTVEVDGAKLSPIVDGASLSEAEMGLLRAVLGARAVYLPAFRAVLERSASDLYAERDSQAEFEAIRNSEIAISREATKRAINFERSRDLHRITAFKTVQCRKWFGSFVPVIRYPSLIDVRSRLMDEVRDATFETSVFEQKLFSQLFINVFKAIAGQSPGNEVENSDHLLEQVQKALSSIEISSGGSTNVYAEIREAVESAQRDHVTPEATTNRILAIYADLLERRAQIHRNSFNKIRDFERSVNLFLDGKKIKLDEPAHEHIGGRATPMVTSVNGRPMNLSALSSGERQVVTMIFCASRLAENRGIFLVDEPELSLHVDWQRSILGEVMRQASGRQVIACTHSPEVGADHFDSIQNFDPELSPAFQDDLLSIFEGQEDA